MSNKKENLKYKHEQFHLWVYSTLHQLPGFEIPRRDISQKPDFRYQCDGLITGIEHTEIKRTRSGGDKPSLAELKGTHRGIVRKAARLALELGFPPLHIEVPFDDHYYKYPGKGDNAVHGLLSTVEKNLDKVLEIRTGDSI